MSSTPKTISRRQVFAHLAGTAGWLAAAAAGAQSAASAEAAAPPLPAIGSSLAVPEVPLLDGSFFKPAQANGQLLVVYWWASWCPFCALQSPYMEKLWREQRPRGLQMLALSIDRKREDAVAYLSKKGYTFPVSMVTAEIARQLPKPKGLPVTLVRARDGRVALAEAGQLFPEDVAQIATLL